MMRTIERVSISAFFDPDDHEQLVERARSEDRSIYAELRVAIRAGCREIVSEFGLDRIPELSLPVVEVSASALVVHQAHGYGHVKHSTGRLWWPGSRQKP